MKYCKRCLMPDTRPHTIFTENGLCQACVNYEAKKKVDWGKRWSELKALCDKYRKTDGSYDCVIPVSGGKDSYFLTYIMKEKMGMNPLLICVNDPFSKTEAGTKNFANLGTAFNCDSVVFNISVDLFRRVTTIGFEELGEPLRFVEAAIYTAPTKLAVSLGIPLIVFGENAAYEYGTTTKEDYSAKKYIEAGHSAAAEKLGTEITDFWLKRGISMKEMNAIIPPSLELLEKVNPEPIFMSYFTPWDDEQNYQIAKRYGFTDLTGEWRREGNVEDYGQIDSISYIVHLWMKYPKFGFGRATDITSRWVRSGKITREEGIKLVMKYDHRLDKRSMQDFIAFMGYTPKRFWDIVEKFWNKDLFEYCNGAWKLKNPLWKLENPTSYLSLPPYVDAKESSV
jgi:N-acetyl sugar amidotransferase